jgi:hypothetical protein
MEVDGSIVAPFAYTSYVPKNADYRGFEERGYELFSGCIYASDYSVNEYEGNPNSFEGGIWLERDRFDFSSLERVLSATLGDNPKGYLMLRINLNMPAWWRRENPDQMMTVGDGTTFMQSSFSQKWLDDAKFFLLKIKEYIDSTKYKAHVIAFQPAAMSTEEWFCPVWFSQNAPDFSVPAQKGFQAWCENKYGEISLLNGAWNSNYSSFLQIAVPSLEKRAIRYQGDFVADSEAFAEVVDFYQCLSDSYANAIIELGEYIKSIYDGDIFVGTFYGYLAQIPVGGHNSMKKVLDSDCIDYFASPFAYVNQRQTAEDWFAHSAMETVRQYKKLWFMEADVRTNLTLPLYETNPELFDKDEPRMHLPVWFGPKTEEESCWNITRCFARVFCYGQALWWFDMWGGWYKSEKMMSLLEKMKALYQTQWDMPFVSVSEVAVILDEKASFLLSNDHFLKTHYCQLVELGSTGVPYDLLLNGCVNAEQLQRYKCVIFIAPYEPDALLLGQLARQGKTVALTGKNYGDPGENVIVTADSLSFDSLISLFQKAGVHRYVDKKALIFVRNGFLSITAAEDDCYALSLKGDGVLTGVFDGEKHESHARQVLLSLRKNQTKFFKVDGVK